MKAPTNAARVRDWLEKHATEDDGRTFVEIREALGFTTRQLNGVTCVELRRGSISSSGTRNSKRYWRSNDLVKLAEFTAWERRTADANRRARGIPSRKEYDAALSIQAAERKARDAAHRRARSIVRKLAAQERVAQRAVQREAAKAEAGRVNRLQSKRQQNAAKKVGVMLAAVAKRAVARAPKEAPPAPIVKRETITQWKKRTGKDIERLAPGVVSEKERLKGHQGLNFASWEARKQA